jgi:hypothetical protein
MVLKKCKCGSEYEDEGFKTMCVQCFAKSKNGFTKTTKNKIDNKDQDIHRQVFLKVASEQLKGVQVVEIINYAKQLEKAFNEWS